jgi:hypothetical protein
VTIERRSRRFSSERLERLAQQLMNASTLCSLAKVSPGGRAHINHTYWAGRIAASSCSEPPAQSPAVRQAKLSEPIQLDFHTMRP